MANAEHVKIVLAGKDAIEQWRKNHPNVRLDLTKAKLNGAELPGAPLAPADLTEADLTEADLTNADLTKAKLIGATLIGATLIGATLTDSFLISADLTGAKLIGAKLTKAKLTKAKLTDSFLISADLTGAKLIGAKLTKAKLIGADLTEAQLNRAKLNGAFLTGADLTGAKLAKADIRGVTVDSDTQFKDLKSVKGLHVDRSTVEYMFPDSLTRGPKMMDMNVVDDLATLRASFSGFAGWIYWLGLIAILFPPVWFVCVQTVTTEAIRAANSWVLENPQLVSQIPGRTTREPAVPRPAETITLLTAVGRYLYNGGHGWREGWKFHWTFLVFLVSLAYRIASFLLLADTIKRLQHQRFTGTPARFSFTQPLQVRILWVSKWTFPLGTYQSWYDRNRRLSVLVAVFAIINLLHHLQMLIVIR